MAIYIPYDGYIYSLTSLIIGISMLKGTCRITVTSTPPLAPVHRMDLTESESKEHGQAKIILSSC